MGESNIMFTTKKELDFYSIPNSERVLEIQTKFKCWNCKAPVDPRINKQSRLGSVGGLVCNECGEDMVNWYIKKGLITSYDLINFERIANAKM